MNYNDHNPPHFHARYQEQDVLIEIETGIVRGSMPKRALQMILEWLEQHRDELLSNWNLARNRSPLVPVPPLS
jgi:hypothetical protein